MEICYLENGEGNKSNNKIHWFNKKFCQKVGGLKKEKKKKKIFKKILKIREENSLSDMSSSPL